MIRFSCFSVATIWHSLGTTITTHGQYITWSFLHAALTCYEIIWVNRLPGSPDHCTASGGSYQALVITVLQEEVATRLYRVHCTARGGSYHPQALLITVLQGGGTNVSNCYLMCQPGTQVTPTASWTGDWNARTNNKHVSSCHTVCSLVPRPPVRVWERDYTVSCKGHLSGRLQPLDWTCWSSPASLLT